LDKVWDLNNNEIGFGLRLYPRFTFDKYEQVYITYGERSGSFLLTEYGFTIPDNPYDFVRVDKVSINTFTNITS